MHPAAHSTHQCNPTFQVFLELPLHNHASILGLTWQLSDLNIHKTLYVFNHERVFLRLIHQ